ncbi:MAG: metallophosphoesterase [Flavobacteriales bacterium]|nr:metallophosphoesterase [Flavobacteriales bacterium]
MKQGRTLLAALALLLLTMGSKAQVPAATHVLYAIGDAGESGEDYSAPVLRLLDSLVQADAPTERTILFLGDNIYPLGLHSKDHKLRAADEARLDAQLNAVKDLDARVIFIPGNHDWQQGGDHGMKFVRRQEEYVEKALGKKAFLPDDGCPGPVLLKLGKDAVLLILDTQWWLHHHRKPVGEKDGCEFGSEADVIAALSEELKDAKGKRIIVAGHHPLYTQGEHGGHFPLREHLFPFTALSPKAYVPLPVLGSLYPLYRKLLGDVQDLAHSEYQDMRTALLGQFKQVPGLVYLAGHEHGLQYREQDGVHHVVSGSGSKATYLRHSKDAAFLRSERGLVRLVVHDDGSLRIGYHTISGGTIPAYEVSIPAPPSGIPVAAIPKDTTTDLAAGIAPNADLKASWMHRMFFGSLYRDLWTTPVSPPLMLLDTLHGGAVPKKLGGGMQTRSLRLKAADDREYVLRDVHKYPANALPLELRGTIAEQLVSDGIAASNPYAAVVMPPLSRAVGVPFLRSELVRIPHQRALGEYDALFGGTLALLEERPKGDVEEREDLGGGEEIIGSGDLIHALHSHQDHVVDDRAMVRARLFDMLIGDWDRHDDQWLWSVHKEGKRTVYRPIPRDRDQAFFTQNGLLPKIVSRRWAMRKFQSFGPDIRDISGQNFNARYLDRAYLAGLALEDWLEVADSMRTQLTDADIDAALALFPDTARTLHGARIEAGLKGRRDRLSEIAERAYREQAHTVDIVGTDEDEYIEVIREGDEVIVRMYPLHKGEKVKDELMYERRFHRSETREIRIYGLEGHDKFEMTGEVRRSIKVRVIGGTSKDVIHDHSLVRGPSCQTVVYETRIPGKKKNKLKLEKETRLRMRKVEHALEYDRESFVHDRLMPLVNLGSNPDDGFFFGAGFNYTRQGFRVEPYKWRHQAMVSFAPRTGAFFARYRGQVNEVMGRWGLGMELNALAPDFNHNFFGFGNNTPDITDREDYAYRVDMMQWSPYATITLHKVHTFRIGGSYLGAGRERLGTADDDPDGGAVLDVDYAGVRLGYELLNVDRTFDPGRGVRFKADLAYDRELKRGIDLPSAGAELTLYIPIALPTRTVLVLRGGANRRDGAVDPLMAEHIGGRNTVRGMRRARFTGNSNAYFNGELRVDLFNYRNQVAPFRVGVLAFADAGRVWADGLTSHNWHSAFGGGLYISPFNMLVLQGSYAVSDVDATVDVRLGFFF